MTICAHRELVLFREQPDVIGEPEETLSSSAVPQYCTKVLREGS